LDIVARDGATLVFVEVKTRTSACYGAGADAVTAGKRRRIVQLATDYISRRRLGGCACRFDVVSIRFEAGGPVIEVFQNAFDA
jgi:putative endonuclease